MLLIYICLFWWYVLIQQMIEALSFLHTNCKCIHRNICPHSIYVTKSGTWKLGGLEFLGNAYTICKPFACLNPNIYQSIMSIHILIFYVFTFNAFLQKNLAGMLFMKRYRVQHGQLRHLNLYNRIWTSSVSRMCLGTMLYGLEIVMLQNYTIHSNYIFYNWY